jgi:hypothetical protein
METGRLGLCDEEVDVPAGSFEGIRTPRAPSGVGIRQDTCLYYPYFSVRDEVWLKHVLVWWDRIATIVPVDVPLERVTDDRLRALAEANAIQAWPVDAAAREKAARAAVELIDQGALTDFPEGEPFELHFGKMTNQLVEELRRRDQIVDLRGDNVLVPRNTGFLVMAVLAHVLAERTRAWPLTDELDLATAYIGIARREGAGGGAVEVVEADLQLMVPNLESVDIVDWLRFREDHRADLEAYRRSVKQLARDVSRAADRDAAEEILDDRREQVEGEIEANRSIFRKLTSETSIVALSFVAEAGALVANPALAGAVAVVAAGALVAKRFRHREIHHLSFLTKAARQFG